MSKTVTAMAIGMLIDDKKLSLDTPLVSIFPEIKYKDKRFKNICVKHLLAMSTGIGFNELGSVTETGWTEAFFASAMLFDAGENFAYNSMNSYILSRIVCKITGMGLAKFLSKRLFEPLHITNYFWERSPEGYEKGGWGLYLSPEGWAKLGYLCMNLGKFEGKKILSQSFIRAMTSTHSRVRDSAGDFDYGYHVWVGRESTSFLFNGMFGQNVLGFPDNGILVVSNAGNEEVFQSSNYYKIAERFFGKVFPDALPEDSKSYRKLLSITEELRPYAVGNTDRKLFGFFKKNSYGELPSLCEELVRKTFIPKEPCPSFGLMPVTLQATQNNYTTGFTKLSFEISKNGIFNVIFTEGDSTYSIAVGFTKARASLLTFCGEPFTVNSYGRFGTDEDGNTVFILQVAFTETPFTRKLKIRFFNDMKFARIEASEQPGESYLLDLAEMEIKNLEELPLINSIVSKASVDYIEYKVNRIMEPRTDLVEVEN